MANKIIEGVEIPEELLEGIAGGALNEAQEDLMRDLIVLFKGMGKPKQSLIRVFDAAEDPELRSDTLRFIEDYWDAL